MATESELRDAIRSFANITTTGVDTATVVRRARARRVPKQVAFSSLSVLAIAGIATLGINVFPSLQPGQHSASDSSILATVPESLPEGAAGGSSTKELGADQSVSNRCGMPTTRIAPNSAGLTLSVSFPDVSPADGEDVVGTVSLTNTGSNTVSGTTAVAPTVVVSRNGITVWHSHGAMIMMAVNVDLAPGESFTYDARFTAVECGPLDDEDGLFPDDLPPLAAGWYEVMAEILFVPDAADAGESFLVGGPAQEIELR